MPMQGRRQRWWRMLCWFWGTEPCAGRLYIEVVWLSSACVRRGGGSQPSSQEIEWERTEEVTRQQRQRQLPCFSSDGRENLWISSRPNSQIRSRRFLSSAAAFVPSLSLLSRSGVDPSHDSCRRQYRFAHCSCRVAVAIAAVAAPRLLRTYYRREREIFKGPEKHAFPPPHRRFFTTGPPYRATSAPLGSAAKVVALHLYF